MSYPEVNSEEFLKDLLRRKEFYSLKADPDRNFRDPPEGDALTGKYLKIHSHQLFVRNFMNLNTSYKRLHLMHGCHPAGTPILMYNGMIKNIETIGIGEQLMGDDQVPRTVIGLTGGREIMYKIVLAGGETFVCNKSHILTIKFKPKVTKNYKTKDIKVSDFIKLPQYLQSRAVIYTTGVDFTAKDMDGADPYLFGLTAVSQIPYNYKCNSRANRLELLAGIIDARGYYDQSNYYKIVPGELLFDDIIYLCRSLGFAACKITEQGCAAYIELRGGNLGDIPVLVEGMRARNDLREDHLFAKFSLEELPADNYYGFEIDGNGRYLLGNFIVTHNTGTGKTIAAISIAQEFILTYKKMYASASAKMQIGRRNYAELDRMTPTVFVMGFGGTKAAFISELLRHPEFGFITISEKEELMKRQRMADAGLPDDIKHYKEYYSSLKKRIVNKTRDGFYKFFGYDEFVNRLFIGNEIKLTDLEIIANQKLRAGENITLEDIIYKYIEDGKIQVNHQLLQQFENSLLICDEIHNTYNMNMKNNRGVAIQFVLDTVQNLRVLTLSATPINNSPTEVVELINYLVPTKEKIAKRDLFVNSRTLHPGSYERIGNMTRGRVSFLQDANIKYFPKRIFKGAPIIIPIDVADFKAGTAIPYLKFVQCPMSQFHQQTNNHHLEMVESGAMKELERDIELVETLADEEEEPPATSARFSYHSIPTDGYSIYDIAFPNPDSDEYGLFRSNEIRNKINLASHEWRDKKKIFMKKFSAINNLITGEFLFKDNLKTYSTKYASLLDEITSIIASSGGDPDKCQKIMIYHDRVKMSGVLLIQEILRMNNFLDEYSQPVDSTICCVCGRAMSEHVEPSAHAFHAVRFIMAHSDVDKIIMDQSLAKFNFPNNNHGHKYMILVGSKIIKESYNFKDIQHLLITSLPVNIPTLIQVFGRCVRKNSHINLPPEQRVVNISLFVSTINPNVPNKDPTMLSSEVYRYIDKLSDYIVIQHIEYEINRNAIDADIHRDINMPPELRKQYFPNGEGPVNTIGNLYFDPTYTVEKYNLNELNLSTFTAYKYAEEEVKIITMIIKRLFITQPVWTYEDLWDAVRRPPFGIEVNPKLFGENNFIIALHNLVVNVTNITSLTKQRSNLSELLLVEKLFDYNERYIYVGGTRHKIEQIGKFYILFPIAIIPKNPLNVVYAEYIEHIRDKDRSLIRELADSNEKVIIDIETYLHPIIKKPGIRINIDEFVNDSKADVNYVAKKNKFKEDYKTNAEDMYSFLTDYSSHFQMLFLEDAIAYHLLGKGALSAEGALDDDMIGLYGRVIELFDKFKIVIYLDEVRKYQNIAKQYKFGVPDLPDKTPLGYTLSKSIRLIDPQIEKFDKGKMDGLPPGSIENARWFEISKIAMNRHLGFKENEVIIGYLEGDGDTMKFKLRKPVQLIRAEVAREAATRKVVKSRTDSSAARTAVGDTRLIERGRECNTKDKQELLKIISALGISASTLERSDIRIKRLCEIIKFSLIESEINERQKDSKWKYIYSWWNEQPILT